MTNNCTKCEHDFIGKHCSNCGHPATLTRITGKYILSEIGSTLNFEKGILYTIKELTIRPGASVRTFILEDRSRLVKPIIFLVISSIALITAQQVLGFDNGTPPNMKDSGTKKVMEWGLNNYAYINIIHGILIGLWTRLLFKKSGYNIYEIFILIFFVMGIGNLISVLFGILELAIALRTVNLALLVSLIYTVWAIGSFFDKKKASSYFKSFTSFALGYLVLWILFILSGILIDIIDKN